MALADTARLIASLELQDKFSGTAKKAEQSMGRLEGTAARASRGIGVAGVAIGTALGNLGSRAVSAGIRGVVTGITAGVHALNELQSAEVATATVIKSTDGIAGQSAQTIRRLAEKYEGLNATIDDKVIQSGENLLLTFTNIRTQAFEPALEAALNMNEAMGGGEEGLQSTIIQVGKALNDPIKGVTALRRVGVQLSRQQEDQIKTLIEQNDLYGAQRIILDELSTQFGGRFAAAGKTAEGQQAALRDRIEDVQKALAGPLLPAIDRARDKLVGLLGSERVLAGADRLGGAIAGLFSDKNLDRGVALIERAIDSLQNGDFRGVTGTLGTVVQSVAGLPWASIADAGRFLGTGAKAALDFFLQLPPWVQTAVLTGWGLNKLTGGAAGSIIGSLASGLIKGILNMNAGVVNINAATVNGPGGGVPGTGGKGGGKLPLLGAAGALGVALTLTGSDNQSLLPGATQHEQLNTLKQAGLLTDATFQSLWARAYGGENISAELDEIRNSIATSSATASSIANSWNSEQRGAYARLTSAGYRTATATELVSQKDFSPTVTVHASFQGFFSIHEQRRVQQSATRSYSDLSGGI